MRTAPFGTVLDGPGLSWGALGPVREPFWTSFGASWGYSGRCRALLGCLGHPGNTQSHHVPTACLRDP
eukprot:7562019-Pyramimonas_sp.AAC.1